MGAKGQRAWNKTAVDGAELAKEYSADRGAVRRLAKRYGCSVVAIYARLESMGIKRRRGGNASVGTQARERNPNWSGGRRFDAAGYVVVNVGGREVREHRVVAERALGRPLAPGEVVHHKNGDRADNRPSNLEVLASQSEHMREHARRRRAALKAVAK